MAATRVVLTGSYNPAFCRGFARADDGDRTRDLRLGKPTLYQLSYVRTACRATWWRGGKKRIVAVEAAGASTLAAVARSSRNRFAATAAVAAFVALCAVALAPAALACPKTTLADVEDEVMCPVCGTPLGLATEAPQAERERAFIQRLVDRCYDKQQIKRALVAEFGPRVLAVPPDEGTRTLSYTVPVVGVAAAFVALAFGLRRWQRARRTRNVADDAGAAAAGGVGDPNDPRVERALERSGLW